MKRTVAVLTHSGDEYVPDLVVDAVRACGHDCVRVDTDRFPGDLALTTTNDGRAILVDTRAHSEIDLARIDALWCRRIWPAHGGVDVDPRYADACAAQAREALEGVIEAIDGAAASVAAPRRGSRVINPLAAQRRAENKIVQMAAARALGLAMPATVVTNDPVEARAFIAAQRRSASAQGVVAKMLVPLSQTIDASGPFVYTSPVDDGDIDDLDGLRAAPMILQARVEKVREIRAVVVGDAVYAGSATVDALDWRRGLGSTWSAVDLPGDVAESAVAVVGALGLVFGAVDFVVDAGGVHWFLEVNPAGEWGFLSRDAGLPIADALARALVE